MLENGQLATLNIKDILPNRFQPRIHFDEVKLNELAESIRKYGLIQPIVVRQIGTKYEIVAGERRFKASTIANKETIPAIIVALTDRDSEEIALLENVQREDLTPIEEAVSYKRILDTGYITQEELAKKIGKSQSSIANKIRLLNLDDTVQEALLHGKISERHARSLLKIHNDSKQVEMLNRIINERLTVKMTDKAIKEMLENPTEPEKEIETLSTTDKPVRRAVPVASHKIIKVSPPPELEERIKRERGNKMDIDKILEEAKDITPPDQPKPANDIAGLMQADPNTVASPLIQSEEPVVQQPEIKPGKFVTPVMNVEAPAEPQPAPMPENTNQVNFDNIFNQTPAGINPTPQPEMPTTGMNIPQDYSMQNMGPVMPDATMMPAAEPVNSINSQASMEPNIPLQPVNIAPMEQPQPERTFVNPVMDSLMQPQQQPQQETVVAPEPQINELPGPEMPTGIAPTPQPEMPAAGMNIPQDYSMQNMGPVMPDATMTPNDITPNNNQFQPIAPEPILNEGITQPTPMMPPTMNVPDDSIIENSNPNAVAAPEQSAGSNVEFVQVINLIRNCANEIEKMGYYIDVDEIDLSDKYQVTFKIDKE